ncbi:MAG TPA: ferritin family protein [Candidatus Methanoperedens sp.]|nr:ferritin family protein [Candidatus Methanoperedens sp.]
MDIYEFAMQMEKDGEAYYRECAANTASGGLRGILEMLAQAEATHFELFRRMRAREEASLGDSKLLEGVTNIFAEIRKTEGAGGARASEADLYRKAQEIEKRSWELYEGAARQAASPGERLLFERVAVEERRHFRILEGIVAFVTRPDQWLENAEWHHLEEY